MLSSFLACILGMSLHVFSLSGTARAFGSHIEKAILRASGRDVEDFVHVDMAAKMVDLGLDSLMPSAVWPPPLATRELATKIKKLKGYGQKNPFVCVDLRK